MHAGIQTIISLVFTAIMALQLIFLFKRDDTVKMLTRIQIAFSINVIVAIMVLQLILHFRHHMIVPITQIFQLLTATWAALDSAKLDVRKYKSLISFHPVAVFALCAILWIFYLPVYLVVRNRILSGNAELKAEPQAHPPS